MFTSVYWSIAKWASLILGTVLTVWWLVSSIYDSIYDNGRRDERAQWQEKEGQLAAARLNKIKELEKALVNVEEDHRRKMADIESKHIKELEVVNEQKERDITAAYAGVNKLRWKTSTTGRNGAGPDGTTGSGSRVCIGKEVSELPPKITADLYSIANDADRNTLQLSKCQETLISYRDAIERLINEQRQESSNEKIPKDTVYTETTN